jgi:Tol biopolymer transport system component/DNA-binding winged helix-turn-helix (wHTH) protein
MTPLSGARMAQVAPTARIIKFGVFEVDLEKEEVRKSGLRLRLRGQPFQVLSILLERPGDVVTREEFQQRLWTDDKTFVDFEHGLNAVVNRLREVLGDSPENPHFIETVPRRGYRWLVPVRGVGARSDPAAPRRRLTWLFWPAGLVFVVLGGVALRLARPTSKPPAALISTPLTARPGIELDPSFSPDGNQIAFSWYDENADKAHIYVKLIDTAGPPLQLTDGSGEDYSPAWSPDGRFIAFFRGKSLVVDFGSSTHVTLDKAEVLLIPALGGPERKITDIFVPNTNNVPGPFLAWSTDGNSLVISEQDAPKEPAALFVVAIDTGERRRLTFPPLEASGDTSPAFSPDGRALAFIRMTDVRPELYLLAVSAKLQPLGEARRISLGGLRSLLGHIKGFAPAWTEDGREIVISSWGQGLWRIGVSGSATRSSEPERLPFGDDACCPAISRRGHRLAYSNEIRPHFSIWRGALLGGPSTRDVTGRGSLERPFISSTRNDLAPQFSPDGKKIAFASQRSGNWEIWVCNRDGSSPVQLTSFQGPTVTTPRWSPDGTRIAFDSDAGEEQEFDIWVIAATGGKPTRMTNHPANDGNPSWSHDGSWIYFDSARTGEQQVWKMPADGGDAVQVTQDGGYAPLESPDGKFLYYTKGLVATSVWRVPLGGGQASKVLENLSTYNNLAIVDNGIYFVPLENMFASRSIQFLNSRTSQITPVLSFERMVGFIDEGGLAVSPDGRWILYSKTDQVGAELRLVQNFR